MGKRRESNGELTLVVCTCSAWPEMVEDGGNGAVKLLGRVGEDGVDLPNGGGPA